MNQVCSAEYPYRLVLDVLSVSLITSFLHLNSVAFGCFVLRNLDYSCLFHWIMGSGQIRDNLKMCRGRLFRVVLPHLG